jgi:phosphocarrier protein HPr
MANQTVTIINKRGLHARAAAKFASTAAAFNARVQVRIFCEAGEGHWTDGKSVMSLMLLAASQGTSIELLIEGDDELLAMETLCGLIANRFEEDE